MKHRFKVWVEIELAEESIYPIDEAAEVELEAAIELITHSNPLQIVEANGDLIGANITFTLAESNPQDWPKDQP